MKSNAFRSKLKRGIHITAEKLSAAGSWDAVERRGPLSLWLRQVRQQLSFIIWETLQMSAAGGQLKGALK